jgi:hypothetical protein
MSRPTVKSGQGKGRHFALVSCFPHQRCLPAVARWKGFWTELLEDPALPFPSWNVGFDFLSLGLNFPLNERVEFANP